MVRIWSVPCVHPVPLQADMMKSYHAAEKWWSLAGVSQCRCLLGAVCWSGPLLVSLSPFPSHREVSNLWCMLPQLATPLHTSVNPAKLELMLRQINSSSKLFLSSIWYSDENLTSTGRLQVTVSYNYISTVGLHTFSPSNNLGSRQSHLA